MRKLYFHNEKGEFICHVKDEKDAHCIKEEYFNANFWEVYEFKSENILATHRSIWYIKNILLYDLLVGLSYTAMWDLKEGKYIK